MSKLGKRDGFKVAEWVRTPASTKDSPYFCRVYLCKTKSCNDTGYCVDHTSKLRPGLPAFAYGSVPVVRRTSR